MLYLVYGDDRDKALVTWAKLRGQLEGDHSKVFEVDEGTQTGGFEDGVLAELIDSQDLFGGRVLVLCKDLLSRAESRDWVVDNAKSLQDSLNSFALLEGKLDKKLVTKLGKKTEVTECALSETAKAKAAASKKAEFSRLFRITDALGARNKKKAWIEYHKLLLDGVDPKEVYWKLWWQSKNMLLASQTSSAKESGLNPYVHQKSAGYARNYGHDDLVSLSDRLMAIMYDTNRGKSDLTINLEQALMSL